MPAQEGDRRAPAPEPAPVPPGGAAVTARSWGYRYPGRPAATLVDVDLAIGPGELVVLMGPSGSGKSTLLAALAGTLPEGGVRGTLEVTRSGDPSAGPGGADSGTPVVGLVQQEPEGNIVMERVGDDVAFPLENAAVRPDLIWPRVQGALAAVGLTVPLEARTGQLSGGQQQLLAVAAAAVRGPALLLLDEPTANLDGPSAARVVAAVQAVRRGIGSTVVVVEHRVEPWLARADRVLIASEGTVTDLRPSQLAAHLSGRPDLAARTWVDHAHLPREPPRAAPGGVALRGAGVCVDGRLAEVDLTVRAGEVVALTGAPGSGKSTLLAVLAGLMEPTAGTVEVRAGAGGMRRDPWTWPAADIAATFGVVFQNPEHQFVTSRVRDELLHGLAESGVPTDLAQQRAAAMSEQLHLAELADVDPFTLSGGEQRRLSVGTALILDPRLLLLDEPTFGQDPATWAEVVRIIAGHRDAGGAVVLATHDPSLVEALDACEVRLVAVGSDGDAQLEPQAHAGAQPRTGAGLRRVDPVALLGTAGLLSAAALVSPSAPLNLALAVLALLAALLGGLPGRRVALLAAPAVLAAASVGFSNALLSQAGVTTAQAWEAAAVPASRVMAVALPGLVAAVALDPTALADALVVRLRVPARAACSALAGLRLLPLLADEWTILARASRARGLAGSGLAGRARQFASMAFRLLVGALRRAGRLAIALDARGLRPDTPRTIARPLRWHSADTAALAVGVLAVLGALALRLR